MLMAAVSALRAARLDPCRHIRDIIEAGKSLTQPSWDLAKLDRAIKGGKTSSKCLPAAPAVLEKRTDQAAGCKSGQRTGQPTR